MSFSRRQLRALSRVWTFLVTVLRLLGTAFSDLLPVVFFFGLAFTLAGVRLVGAIPFRLLAPFLGGMSEPEGTTSNLSFKRLSDPDEEACPLGCCSIGSSEHGGSR